MTITAFILSLLILSFGSPVFSSEIQKMERSNHEMVNFRNTLDQPTLGTLQIGENLSRPILESVSFSNGSAVNFLRERNDSLGLGAIIEGNLYENYTITYLVVNGTQSTKPLLHTNAPGMNSSLDFNNKAVPQMDYVTSENRTEFVLPYDPENPLANVTVARYKIVMNVTADYIIFYAEVSGISEDRDQIRNLISVDLSVETKSKDEFYIQNENVTILLDGTGYNSNATFGVQWREATKSVYKTVNFTSVVVNQTSGEYSANVSLGRFEPGTTIIWRTIVYNFDNIRNTTILINLIDTQSVEIGDGTPKLSLDFEIPHEFPIFNQTVYTNEPNMFINASATVPKGNITHLEVEILDLTTNQTTNFINLANTTTVNTTLEMNKDFNVSISAFTDKNLNDTIIYTVITDNVKPSINSFAKDTEDLNVIRFNRTVTFFFNFTDDHAGVELATLDLGNGVAVDVTGLSEFTYVYPDFDDYEVKLIIWDKAGNMESSSILFTLAEPDLPQEGALFDPFWGSFMALVIGLLVIYLAYTWFKRR
ncbi:MAG: hypothetical protein D6732_27910 [Methanobacteriota archaeon]|nr:MAG: hypothetical protein D6732_27910 [Euryarchaeota archaeon]